MVLLRSIVEKVRIHPTNRKVSISWVIWLLLFLSMFYYASSRYPLRADDYWYNYTIEQTLGGEYHFSETRVSTLSQLATSLQRHQSVPSFTGRLACYVFIVEEYLLGFDSWLIPALNTFVLLISIYLAQLYCFKGVSPGGTALALLLGCLYLPDLGTAMWRCNACNYLWGSLILIAALVLLEKQLATKHTGRIAFSLGLLLFFICGWWHEGMGVPLLGAMSVLFVLRKGKCGLQYIAYGVALLAGCMLSISQGTVARAGVSDSIPLYYTAVWLLKIAAVYAMQFLLLPFIIFLCCLCVGRFHLLRRFKDNALLIVLGVVYAVFCATFASKGAWGGGYFYPLLVLWLLTMRAVPKLPRSMSQWSTWSLFALACILMGCTCYLCHCVDKTYREVLSGGPELNGDVYVFEETPERHFHAIMWTLPLQKEPSNLYNRLGPLFGKSRFFVIVNRNVEERDFYPNGEWMECGAEGISTCWHGETLLVRMSAEKYGTLCEAVVTRGVDTEKWEACHYENGLLDFFHRNNGLKLYSTDYDGAYFYIILPRAGSCSMLTLPLWDKASQKREAIEIGIPQAAKAMGENSIVK